MTEVGDRWDLHRLDGLLETDRLGRKVELFDQIDSTNAYALERCHRPRQEGLLIVAEFQSRGRGRQGRHWFSPAGVGIYASLVLQPRLPPHRLFPLSLMAGVAVAEAIRCCCALPACVKWPNDVLVHEKKVGGVLLEVRTEAGHVEGLVVGLGINVNNDSDALPRDNPRASSLRLASGTLWDRHELLAEILNRMEPLYRDACGQRTQAVLDRWRALTEMFGRRVVAEGAGHPVEGVAVGLSERGELVVQTDEGRSVVLHAGEVHLAHPG